MGMITGTNFLAFLLRPKRKVGVFIITGIWLLIFAVLFRYYQPLAAFQQVKGDIYDGGVKQSTTAQEKEAYAKIKETIFDSIPIQKYQEKHNISDGRKIEAHSSIYDIIFANHAVNSVLGTLNFEQRCDLYFTTLYTDSNTWYLNPDKELPLVEDNYDYKEYRKKETKDLKKKIAEDANIEVDDVKEDLLFEARMRLKYAEFLVKAQNIEQTIVDYLSHLRIFNKCYVTRDNIMERDLIDAFINNQNKFITALKQDSSFENGELSTKNQGGPLKFISTKGEKLLNTDSFGSCSNLESRLYPWLSFTNPTFERWTKEISFLPPDLRKYNQPLIVFEPSHVKSHQGKGKAGKLKSKLTNDSKCFLTNFKNSLNGKGLVLSVGDGHVDDTVRLIHLLRALNNKYPIQIVYNNGLSEESKDKIRMAAREAFSTLPSSFKKVTKYFPEDYLDPKDGGLPKQEVWFVNVHNVIQDKYKKKFHGYANKFLAAMFNSFEEYMLIDADSVLVQNPDFFFQSKKYKELGAYFYKDRSAIQFRPETDIKFFKKITPSVLDQVIFNIPTILEDTFKKYEFFDGLFHYMESGLVMINRNLHFNSVLTMIQMNFLETVTRRVHGDKETFWLGFLATGEENFHFNKFYAAALGEVTPMADRVRDDHPNPFLSREICATHPGHIDGEDGKSLVWFNSGYKFCGKSSSVNFEEDFGQGRRYKQLKNIDQMKVFYNRPMTIKNAIVPPFKDKFHTHFDNDIGEPKDAWSMDGGYCCGYLWCAYDRIGGTTKDGDNTQFGTFIEFDEKSVDLFRYYGDIWIGNE